MVPLDVTCLAHPPSSPIEAQRPSAALVVLHPYALSVIAAAAGLGWFVSGWLAAVAMLGGTLLLASWIGSLSPVKDWAARDRERRARERWASARLQRLKGARSTRTRELAELTDVVARMNPARADSLEMDALLDQYADVAVALERYTEVLGSPGPVVTLGADGPPAGTACAAERSPYGEIVRRRLQHRERCRERVAELGAQLDGVAELIHMAAEKAATPCVSDELEREIAWRAEELEACDEAMRSLCDERAGEPEPAPKQADRLRSDRPAIGRTRDSVATCDVR